MENEDWQKLNEHVDAPTSPTTGPLPSELILLIFIHGFKGDDKTFLNFPERLQHLVSETVSNATVESVVFPLYETRGELDATVERFADWLATLTVERENANGVGGGAGKAKIVLCGHSMGGIVAADALLGMVNARPDITAPLWPNIIALIAFDTPYLGLHPFVFKNTATKAFGYVQSAHQLASSLGFFQTATSTSTANKSSPAPRLAGAITAPSSPTNAKSTSAWSKWATPAAYTLGGLVVGGAAAGTAYLRRDDLGFGFKWATDHLTYVGTLWDEGRLKKRVEGLAKVAVAAPGDDEDKGGRPISGVSVVFRNFYTLLPASPPAHPNPRTFTILPSSKSHFASALYPFFVPAANHIVEDEIEAHTGMFAAQTNDGYYKLGLEAAAVVRGAVELGRAGAGLVQGVEELI